MDEKVIVQLEFEHISIKDRSKEEIEKHIINFCSQQKDYLENNSNSYRINKIEIKK